MHKVTDACISQFSLSPAPSQPPSDLSATILSSSSLSISWMSVSGADGYIVNYNGGKAVLTNMTDYTLSGLNKGKKYNISIYSFSSLPYISAKNLSVNFNGKWFQPHLTNHVCCTFL